MGALDHSGVFQQAFGAMEIGGQPQHDDPVEQLAKLGERHRKGVLSDCEFAVAKQKLLERRWKE